MRSAHSALADRVQNRALGTRCRLGPVARQLKRNLKTMDAPDKPSETPATTNAALPNTSPTTPAPAPTPKNPFPELDKSLGVVEVLSDPEQMEYFACEEVVGTGWSTFVQVGLALAQIRDHRLYRVDFDCFEAYCQAKWQYGGRYVNRLISAAKVFTYLGTISSLKKLEHEKPTSFEL